MKPIKILVVGTFDTKSDELNYLSECIVKQGATPVKMDVSVLGDVADKIDVSKHDVAAAADKTIDEIIAYGDENQAMQVMAEGSCKMVSKLYAENQFDGLICLGGSMATDLALDITQTLPIGVPKYIISTVAFAAMIPPERLAVDIQMILWAGGLYGLNSICKSTLSQAAGSIVGSSRSVERSKEPKPLIGMTSLGKSCLTYMVKLKPELEKRGFEVAIFHATGMGGRAFEALAAKNEFVAVVDFCTQELGNWVHGSIINAGSDRLQNAGKAGIPQLIAPGAIDLVDLPTWMPTPEKFITKENHVHNRLINSVSLNSEERVEVAEEMINRFKDSVGPIHVLIPTKGVEQWDREGQPLYAPEDLNAFNQALIDGSKANKIEHTVLNCHINDDEFVNKALEIFDGWLEAGIIKK